MADPNIVKEFETALNPPAETQVPPETPTPQTPPPTVEELEIALGGKPFKLPLNAEIPVKHNGQILKTPLEKLLNSYRQSTHLEDRIKEYKTLKEEAEKLRGDVNVFEEQRKKYGAIQDWSEQNPQDWERLYELFQNKDRALLENQVQGQPNIEPLLGEISRLKQELEGIRSWKSDLEKQQEEELIEKDTERVKSEIDDFKKNWPEIDLEERNLEGVSLKGLIMQHGIKRGLGEFKLAALDFLGPRLLDLAQQRGRNEAVKGIQKETQQGIVARSSTPQGQSTSEVDPSKLSKSDRTSAAKAELQRLLEQG